jgi:O-antigen ligase
LKPESLAADTPSNRLGVYILAAFVVSLPFDRLYSELALVLFLLHTLIHLNRTALARLRRRNWLLPASIYFLTVAGTIYSGYRAEAFSEWERQLALLLLPLCFVLTTIDLQRYRLFLLKALTLSCTCTVVYLYYAALKVIGYNHLQFSSLFTTAFINHNFAEPINMHATYLSMYIGLAAITPLWYLKTNAPFFRKVLAAFILLVLSAGLLQLASRAVLIAMLVIVNIAVPIFLFSGKGRARYFVLSVIVSLLLVLVVVQNDVFRNRYVTELKNDLTQQSINLNILEPRAVRWTCGSELIKKSPLIGHGSGSEVALLKQQYFDKKYYNSYINDLNIHNQFLSMLIKFGIVGLILLMTVLFVGFKKAWHNKDLFFAAFLIIVSVVFFSENVLDGNKGIFFFAFFYSLFYRDLKHIDT